MEPVHLKHKFMGILGESKIEDLTNHNPHWIYIRRFYIQKWLLSYNLTAFVMEL